MTFANNAPSPDEPLPDKPRKRQHLGHDIRCYMTPVDIMIHVPGCNCPDDIPGIARPNRFPYEEIAEDYLRRLEQERGHMPDWYHMFKLWEESGEVPRQYLIWQGLHRHGRTAESKFAEELADVVITTFAIAHTFGIDLDEAIQSKHTILMTRAMRDDQT
jgi:NTP pyrophosphatase (non-canonical NTP hydrolase)